MRYLIQPKPTVVCLCGSTRFYEAFQRANYELTMQGKIVLSIGFVPGKFGSITEALMTPAASITDGMRRQVGANEHGETVGCTPAQKVALDQLHLRKIDLADEVFVLNVGDYIGESTTREVAYARKCGKPVRWLEHHEEVAK